MLLDELAGPYRSYLALVSDEGRLHGYAGLLAVGSQGDVQTIAVDPAVRGHGHGRRLMETLVEEAARGRVRELFLEVRADNEAARTLYDSLGFAEIGVRPGYYQPEGVDAVVMRRAVAVPGPHDDAIASAEQGRPSEEETR